MLRILLKIGAKDASPLFERTLKAEQSDKASESFNPQDFLESNVQGTMKKDFPKVLKVGEQVEVIGSFIKTGRKPVTETELTTKIDEKDV